MRVLVIEDEKKLADSIAANLRTEGFVVEVCHDGLAGYQMASSTNYDLLILDLMLPGMNGIDLLRRLRKQDVAAAVLVLTARDGTRDKVENFEAGADDYLTKPFAVAELLVRVKALLRRPPSTRTHLVRIADLELDRLTHQVRRAGKRIELTSKEYALLDYLATNAGRVLSRTMIVGHVWDQSFENLTNIVDVYVKHLRTKVDDPFSLKLIRTVRGVGYVLEDAGSPAQNQPAP